MSFYHVNNCDCPIGNCDCSSSYERDQMALWYDSEKNQLFFTNWLPYNIETIPWLKENVETSKWIFLSIENHNVINYAEVKKLTKWALENHGLLDLLKISIFN